MTEEFLHYVWQFRMYSPQLRLVTGELVSVIDPGTWNKDSGPDFFNSRIRIEDTTWAGNVEIHVSSSDWERHGHQFDKAYETVILHVVYLHDKVHGSPAEHGIPVLQLKDRIPKDTWQRYLKLMASKKWIPCESIISDIEPINRFAWLDRLLVERMQRKAALVERSLSVSLGDWNQAFYRLLARNMGFKLNNEAFELLSGTVSYQCLWRHTHCLEELESLIFGQAGMLDLESPDDYHFRLRTQYQHFKRKYNLHSMDAHLWKFLRLHPPNFPTIRLAQFAAIMHQSQGLMMNLLESEELLTIRQLLSAETSPYWQDHFRFGQEVKKHGGRMGDVAIDLLIINLITPLLLVYAQVNGKEKVRERAWHLLESVKAEDNAIIRNWKKYGIEVNTASQSQALIELKSYYCDRKKCLSCNFGLLHLRETIPR
jgi:hypothetical protein